MKNKWTIRKVGGDDLYSWALLKNGTVYMDGMGRDEARWRRDSKIKEDTDAQTVVPRVARDRD